MNKFFICSFLIFVLLNLSKCNASSGYEPNCTEQFMRLCVYVETGNMTEQDFNNLLPLILLGCNK